MDTLAERILPEAKIHEMIALTPEGRDRVLLRLLYATGGRVSEICAIKWRHVQANGDSGQITLFGKGGKTHAVVLPMSIWNDLVAFRAGADDDAPVIVSRKGGGHLDRSQVLRIAKQLHGGRESVARYRRTGSGTPMLHTQWTVVPEFIPCALPLPILRSQLQAVIFTPSQLKALQSSWQCKRNFQIFEGVPQDVCTRLVGKRTHCCGIA